MVKNALSLLIIIGIIGIWYFIKKSPNPKYKMYSIALTSASLILLIITMFLSGDFSKKETASTASSSSITTSTTSSSSKSASSTSQSSSTSSSSSTTETSSSTSTAKELDMEGGKQFAAYLIQQLNTTYAETGYTFNAIGYDETIYITVPQEIKYGTHADIQKIADTFLSEKTEKFVTWANENNYNYKNPPILYVKSEDGTTLAEESVFKGTMTVKVKNN